VILDIVEYIIMEWTMPKASVGKPNMQDMQEGAYPEEKKKSVAGQFAAVKYRSETYCWTQKLIGQKRIAGLKITGS
jgi:hypothetical protein